MGVNWVLKKRISDFNFKNYEMAYKVGISGAHLSRIVNGIREPAVGVAIKIAKALNTNVEQLFDFK